MPKTACDNLSEAIARNSAAVLSLPSAGTVHHHKTRFLDETADGVWLEAVAPARIHIKELISTAKSCAVSFKSGERKISFPGRLLRLDDEYRVNESVVVSGILVSRPAEVKAVQRRNNYRVAIAAVTGLVVRIWRIPEHLSLKDQPVEAAELVVRVRDMSLGGLGAIVLPKNDEPPKILVGERVRIAVHYSHYPELLVEGRVCSLREAGDKHCVRAGVQFKNLQEGMEGKWTLNQLTRIVGTMHQEEVRQNKLKVA